MTKIKVACIGAGRIAGGCDKADATVAVSHAQACDRIADIDLVAVADQAAGQAARFAELWKCPAFATPSALLEAMRPDVVAVCTPNQTHAAVAAEVLSHSCRPRLLIIEKPVCTAPQELTALRAASSRSGVPIVVNHTRRFMALHSALAGYLRRRPLGLPIAARGVYYGGWLTNAVHLLDLLQYLTGERLQIGKLSGVGRGRGPADPLLAAQGVLSESGAAVSIETVDESCFQLFELELHFQDGRVVLRDFANTCVVERVAVNHIDERELKVLANFPVADDDTAPMVRLYRQAGDYCAGKVPAASLISELTAIAPAMETLWQGMELYDRLQKA